MSESYHSRGTRESGSLARNHADLLAHLPDPPETFVASDVPEEYHGIVRSLCRNGVIAKDGFTEYESESNGTRREYRVEEWASERAAEIVAARDAICPCGHSGVRNCGDHYACGFDLCDQEFDRAELEVDA